MRFSNLVTVALFLVSASATQAQELVTNGGFETGDFTGWSTVSPRGDLQVKVSTLSLPSNTGKYYANFGDYPTAGILSQTLATVAGQQYSLSYFLSNYGSGSLATPNEFRVNVGNQVLSDQVNIPYQPFYQAYNFNFVAVGSSTLLQFAGYDPPFALFLDDIRVSGPTSVPEPGSIALLVGMGLSGAGFLARRRRNACVAA